MSWTPDSSAGRGARPRRQRHPADERERLQRITVAAVVAATGLNAVLFLQTAAGPLGSGDPTKAIVSLINAVLPGSGLGAPAASPLPVRGTPPHAVSGGS